MVGRVPAFQPGGSGSIPGSIRNFHFCPGIGCVSFVCLLSGGLGFDPRSGQVSWVRFFRGFSSLVRQMSESFRPPRSFGHHHHHHSSFINPYSANGLGDRLYATLHKMPGEVDYPFCLFLKSKNSPLYTSGSHFIHSTARSKPSHLNHFLSYYRLLQK